VQQAQSSGECSLDKMSFASRSSFLDGHNVGGARTKSQNRRREANVTTLNWHDKPSDQRVNPILFSSIAPMQSEGNKIKNKVFVMSQTPTNVASK